MAEPEASLLRNWRKSLGITQEELGEACPHQISREQVKNVERGTSSATVSTILNVIRGLETAARIRLGRTDQQRLIAFFQGSDVAETRRLSARRLRELANQIEAQ